MKKQEEDEKKEIKTKQKMVKGMEKKKINSMKTKKKTEKAFPFAPFLTFCIPST